MDILENELVRKYFGEERPGAIIHCDDPRTFNYRDWMAGRVLKAMQEPIRDGERFINSDKEGLWMEGIFGDDNEPLVEFHPWMLRLPDKFQAAGKHGVEIGCSDSACPMCRAGNFKHQPPAGKKECCEYSAMKWAHKGPGSVINVCADCMIKLTKPQPPPEPEKHYCKFDPFGLGHCNGKSCLLPQNSCQCARREHESICPRGKPEKCYCIKYGVKGPFTHHSVEDCSSGSIEHKPSDAVESLIDKIVMLWSKQDDLILRLRELVKLARTSND